MHKFFRFYFNLKKCFYSDIKKLYFIILYTFKFLKGSLFLEKKGFILNNDKLNWRVRD